MISSQNFDKGDGVKNPENCAIIICEWSPFFLLRRYHSLLLCRALSLLPSLPLLPAGDPLSEGGGGNGSGRGGRKEGRANPSSRTLVPRGRERGKGEGGDRWEGARCLAGDDNGNWEDGAAGDRLPIHGRFFTNIIGCRS